MRMVVDMFFGGGGGGEVTGMKGASGHRLCSEKRCLIPHSGYSLCVGAVPSFQRSQPGSEQPKLTAERRMQQNKTSTQSRQNHIKQRATLTFALLES